MSKKYIHIRYTRIIFSMFGFEYIKPYSLLVFGFIVLMSKYQRDFQRVNQIIGIYADLDNIF